MKKKTILILSISIVSVLLIFLGSSYAMFAKTEQALKNNEYTTGILQITYNDTGSLDIGKLPLSDTDGKKTTPYTFTIKNTGNIDYQFDLKLVTDTTYVNTHGCANNQIPSNYIKVMLGDNGTPVLLSSLTNSIIAKKQIIAAGETRTYNLRLWLDTTTPNSVIGTHFHGKITTDGEAVYTEEGEEPNAPALAEGMIPIKWNGTTWVKADSTNKNNDWYNYSNKEWANAVMVTSDTRDSYMSDTTKAVGSEVLESDILAYYVWIPRYKYRLFNVNSESIDPIEIQVLFESKDTTKSTGSTNGDWLTHPAFTFGTDELSGIWVGKFTTTGTASAPTIKPAATSRRSQTISALFSASQSFNTDTYLTSNGTSGTDSHMMKNTEWGAVTYLKQSKYGLGLTEIAQNAHRLGKAGCGPVSETDLTSQTTTCTSYTSTAGIMSSTTGNVTGVYDMKGGFGKKYTMGVIKTSDGTGLTYSNSGFTTSTLPLGSKYVDAYTFGTSASDYTRRILGDATGETRGWYSNIASFISSSTPWFLRGGGGFYFMGDAGGGNNSFGTSHTVLTTK